MKLATLILLLVNFLLDATNGELLVDTKPSEVYGKYKFHKGYELDGYSTVNTVTFILREGTTDNSQNNFVALAGIDSFNCNVDLIGYHKCNLNNQLSTNDKKVFSCSVPANFVVFHSMIDSSYTKIDSTLISFTRFGDDADIISKAKTLQANLKAIQNAISCTPIPKLEYTGSVFMLSPNAIPLYITETNDIIVALSAIGKGKFLFFGHSTYANMFTDNTNADFNNFKRLAKAIFSNNNAGGDKSIIVYTNPGQLDNLTVDNIILLDGHRWMTSEHIPKLVNTVKSGVGLILCIRTWQYSWDVEGSQVSVLEPLFVESGIYPYREFVVWGAQRGEVLKTCDIDLLKTPSLLNAPLHLEWVDKSFDVFSNHFVYLDLSEHHVTARDYLKAKLLPILNKYKPYISSISPCENRPINFKPQKALIAAVSSVYSSQLFVNSNQVAVDSSFYPGWTDSPNVKRYNSVTLKIACKYSEMVPTGFYTKPGSTSEVNYVNGDSEGFEISVNPNLFDIRDKVNIDEGFNKWPFTRNSLRIVDLATRKRKLLYSAYGGLIFVSCPRPQANLELTLTNVYEAPYYDTTYQSTISSWPTRKNSFGGHWAIVAGQTGMFTIPAKYASKMADPGKVLEMHDKCLSHAYYLKGQDIKGVRRQFVSSDWQILMGFMHSGYPIGMFVESVNDILNLTKLMDGSWGIHHEYGHNLVEGKYMYEGSGETINNIFALLCEQENAGFPPFDENSGMFKEREMMRNLDRYFSNAANINQKVLSNEPFIHLSLHAGLIDAFGWELYRQVFRKFNSVQDSDVKGDEDKVARWCLFLSQVTGFNLSPYFKFFGLNVNQEMAPELTNFPMTLPKIKVVNWFPKRTQQIVASYPSVQNLIKPVTRIREVIGPYTFQPTRVESNILTIVSLR